MHFQVAPIGSGGRHAAGDAALAGRFAGAGGTSCRAMEACGRRYLYLACGRPAPGRATLGWRKGHVPARPARRGALGRCRLRTAPPCWSVAARPIAASRADSPASAAWAECSACGQVPAFATSANRAVSLAPGATCRAAQRAVIPHSTRQAEPAPAPATPPRAAPVPGCGTWAHALPAAGMLRPHRRLARPDVAAPLLHAN
jgi:hypothetical protein